MVSGQSGVDIPHLVVSLGVLNSGLFLNLERI